MPKTDYNGLVTKVRAMKSLLLTEEDLENMLAMDSVNSVFNFLKDHPKYKYVFDDVDKLTAHRSQIELLVSFSYFEDYLKIYHFAFGPQRQVLSLLFNKFEIDVLKKCLTSMHLQCDAPDLNIFLTFFSKHSSLDIKELCSASSLDDFINKLSSTPYYKLFHSLHEHGVTDIYEYKIQLDIMYYKMIWKLKKKLYSKSTNIIFTNITGVEIDLQNIIHIYRFKKYYDVPASQILKLIIPINHKLNKNDLSNLINSSSLEEFMTIFDKTYYGKLGFDFSNIEQSYNKILSNVYSTCVNKYPCSIAPILSYLFTRKGELDALTTTLECVRYNVKPQKISSYIITI